MNALYHKTGAFRKIEIYTENGIAHFRERTPFGKKVYQIHQFRLGTEIAFSRVYHIPFIFMCLFLGYLGLKLLILRWNSGNWTFYLGVSVVSIIILMGIYYVSIGRKYGVVEFQFGDEPITITMQDKEYREFQSRLSNTGD